MNVVIHLLRAELEFTSPGGVAAPESLTAGSVLTPDLPVARDGDGLPYVPGSSVAGALRGAVAEEAGKVRLFGEVRKEQLDDGSDRTTAVASPVRVLGTRLVPPEDGPPKPAVRRRTAIDRHRAAAEANTLHEREVVPPGTRLTVWLRLDAAAEDSDRLDELLALLRTWRPCFGGGRTTGLGQARLLSVHHRPIDLNTPEGLRHWLLGGGPGLVDDLAELLYDAGRPGAARSAPEIPLAFGRELHFGIVDAIHLGTGEHRERGHGRTGYAPVLLDHEDAPVIPGTSWKGLLRARVEFILRSAGIDTCASAGGGAGDGTCGECATCAEFGFSGRRKHGGEPAGEAGSVGARGTLIFNDSAIRNGRRRRRNHVALDRVFGGARDNLLFTEEVVEDGTLTLRVQSTGDLSDPVRAALVLALYDIHDGRTGIGGGTTRGLGTLTAIEDTARWLESERTAAMAALSAHVPQEVPAT
ncbi:hypothetical protein AA958_03735 [Streptomyces sp. CNQ-509]|uniref:RAMP superfamily CRISPR-associated protein n=1 Tax=Streptomyces sp. CNQ-509 TaxID=444103 RepID=UPI00062E0C0D|nr:RAMP superfamily CRISPR-associated protein [Streptomyces sp. CNQ-509]AKH81447.1 hypothetical protein AA958_03735 [Streptomyces sp. CNQ-509]